MGMALDIKERLALRQVLRAVQRNYGLTPTQNLVDDATAARRLLDERYEAARPEDGGR